jgi:hypothetical protein
VPIPGACLARSPASVAPVTPGAFLHPRHVAVQQSQYRASGCRCDGVRGCVSLHPDMGAWHAMTGPAAAAWPGGAGVAAEVTLQAPAGIAIHSDAIPARPSPQIRPTGLSTRPSDMTRQPRLMNGGTRRADRGSRRSGRITAVTGVCPERTGTRKQSEGSAAPAGDQRKLRQAVSGAPARLRAARLLRVAVAGICRFLQTVYCQGLRYDVMCTVC